MTRRRRLLPEPAVGPWGGWATVAGRRSARGSSGAADDPAATGSSSRRTQGVIHPTLPCGARIFVEYGGQQALTQVVARFPVGQGRQLDLTPRLARRLDLEGVRELRWAFPR